MREGVIMFEKFLEKSSLVFKRPVIIVVLTVVVTLVFGFGMTKLELDNDITHMVPHDNAAKMAYNRYEDIFGNSSLIFIGIETSDIYSPSVIQLIRDISSFATGLNKTIPVDLISAYLSVSPGDARKIIGAISEAGLASPEEIGSLLRDPGRLEGEIFLEAKEASRIAKACRGADMVHLLQLYKEPVKEVKSIVDADYIEGEGKKFAVKKLLGTDEATPENLQRLKKRVNSWDLYRGALVSYDETLTTVLVQMTDRKVIEARTAVYREIRKFLDKKAPEGVALYMDGDPVISEVISEYVLKDARLLIPVVILVVLFALFFSFRNFSGVFYPSIAVVIATVWTMGLMAYTGVQMNLMTTCLPVVLIAVGSAYGIHFMNHYLLHPDTDRLRTIEHNNAVVGLAIVMAGLTTVAGFGSLATTEFTLIRNSGIFTAIGVFFAIAITIYIIPSMVLLKKGEKPVIHIGEEKKDFVSPFLSGINSLVQKHYRFIAIFFLLASFLFGYGITKLRVDINNITFFKPDAPIRMHDDRLNEKLAGTQVLNVIFESQDGTSIAEPALLKKIESFSSDLKKKFPEIKKVVSINDFLKKMNQEMYGGSSEKYRIPESPGKIRDYLLLYSGSLQGVVTDKRDKLRITITMKRSPTTKIREIETYCRDYLSKDYIGDESITTDITGIGYIYLVINDLIVKGQITSLLFSLAVVFLLIFLIFRKFTLTIVGLIPIAFTMLFNFGFMGFSGITLNVGTVMVAGVAIGIGIDYAIHFVTWYRSELKSPGMVSAAIEETIMKKGRGILFNVISVMAGFMVLLFSQFVPLLEFGLLVSLSMVVTGMGALLVIPSVLLIAHRYSK